jgi:hypothetical protein
LSARTGLIERKPDITTLGLVELAENMRDTQSFALAMKDRQLQAGQRRRVAPAVSAFVNVVG